MGREAQHPKVIDRRRPYDLGPPPQFPYTLYADRFRLYLQSQFMESADESHFNISDTIYYYAVFI